MIKQIKVYVPLVLLTTLLFFLACSKKEEAPPKEVDPSNADALQSVLIIPGGTLTSGSLPSSTGASAPVVSNNQTTASISPGNQIQLPFSFTSNSGYSACYVKVNGATNGYIRVPGNSAVNNGTIAIPINIPSSVKKGEFCVTYGIADANGRISNYVQTCIKLKDPLTCGDASNSGSEGLTFTQVQMGDNPGTAVLNYDTYSIPDRIDIYQGSTWLAGTGNNPGSIVPPLSNCSSPAPGFVSKKSTISFNYNPGAGKNITIVVSGCLGGGTAWDWDLDCP